MSFSSKRLIYISYLLQIIHEIQTKFEENLKVDVGGIFLDISNAFYKVCHDSLLYKLKAFDVQGELLSL